MADSVARGWDPTIWDEAFWDPEYYRLIDSNPEAHSVRQAAAANARSGE